MWNMEVLDGHEAEFGSICILNRFEAEVYAKVLIRHGKQAIRATDRS
jgi:hypothetical protein